VLKPANVRIDVDHDLPPDIEALLPDGLRDILDRPRCLAHNETAEDDLESASSAFGLTSIVDQLAAVYRDECRELAKKTGSEPEYRTHLYSDVVLNP
jgi:hypothetical protein